MLGRRIRDLRLASHATQNEIAQVLNISRSAYTLYETDKRELNFETLCRLADHFQVSADYLLGRTDNPRLSEELKPEERLLLERYRELDSRGKDTVQTLLRYEYGTLNKGTPVPGK